MGATPTYALRYPDLDDPDDVPTDMSELALDVEGALNGKQATAAKGVANGYASLDAGGKVPLAQLPATGQLFGTYAARPAANAVAVGTVYFATDTLGQWFSDGTTWTLIGQGVPQITAAAMDSPPWSTPYDGMRMRIAIDTAQGYEWSFVYRAGATSTYKWEFTGGSWQKVYLPGYNSLVCDTAFHNIGFGIIATRRGDYAVRWSASVYNVSAVVGNVYANIAIGSGSISPAANGGVSGQHLTTASSSIFICSIDTHVVNVLTGQGIYEIYQAATGMNVQFGNRQLSIQPIRIG